MEKVITNNEFELRGEVVSGFTFSHEIFGEGFYIIYVSCKRLSNSTDVIPVMVSERLMDIKKDYRGSLVCISGQFRSFNKYQEIHNKLLLYHFARNVEFLDEIGDSCEANKLYLDGFICKEPVYRRTPLGREVADIMLAVNRPYGKSDYIPCICWGRNARFAGRLEVSEHIAVWGRVQSREYLKKLDDGNVETRTAYEVSVAKISIMDERRVEDWPKGDI